MRIRLFSGIFIVCLTLQPAVWAADEKQGTTPFQLNDVRTLGLFPDALLAPATDLKGKRRAQAEIQRAELNDLWAATIAQSRDIQFVVQRLQPTSDKHHESSEAMKYISGALFDISNVVPAMINGPLIVKDSAVAGLNAMRKAVATKTNSADKSGPSVEQATLLYYMVRQIADKLVVTYRHYRTSGQRLALRRRNLSQFQALLKSLDSEISPAASIELRYLISQAQAEIDDAQEQHEADRQQLVELAGADAVDKLDQQIADEGKPKDSGTISQQP